jgi:molybdopterin molybdotransferase
MKNITAKLFKELTPVHHAQRKFLDYITPVDKTETLPIEEASGRVLAENITAERDVPHYARAAMDGYALRAEDTLGASPTSPVILTESNSVLEPHTCIRVHTGSPLPEGADAVIMIEDTCLLEDGMVEITAQLHPYENVGEVGEDIRRGELLFQQNHLLRPVDISLLASLQITQVSVYRKPLISIIPTGEELVPRGSRRSLRPGEILETNSLMAQLYVEKWGGTSRVNEIVTDNPQLIKQAIQENLSSDMIIVCGGTSVGGRDHVPEVISEMGTILTRGIKASPGKPTTTGVIRGVPVLCMPGYPVAGYIALQLFVKPAIKTLARLPQHPEPTVTLPLSEKITSKSGYLTFTRIKIENNTARPIMTSGAGILSSVARSDGYIIIPEHIEGYERGEKVDIMLTD